MDAGTNTAIGQYRILSLSLIANKCYQVFFESNEQCFKHAETFMILDSPSGTGKTLAGVAASRHFSDDKLITKVIHIIWRDAVQDQDICRDLSADEHRRFFDSASGLKLPKTSQIFQLAVTLTKSGTLQSNVSFQVVSTGKVLWTAKRNFS